jgi:hypothetical protein
MIKVPHTRQEEREEMEHTVLAREVSKTPYE